MEGIKAAYVINGEVITGDSHAAILTSMNVEKPDDVLHGYVDLNGKFHESIDELFDSMRHTILIRHAETWYNKQLSTELDETLTPEGELQAEGMSNYLTKMDLSKYVGWVSPLLRTLKTAKAISQKTGLRFVVNPLLAEYGAVWSNTHSVSRIYSVRVPCRSEEFPEFDWSCFPESRIFGAETHDDFQKRMHTIIENGLPEWILIVTHGAVVWTLADLLTEGKHLGKYEKYGLVTNTSVSFIEGHQPVFLFKREW